MGRFLNVPQPTLSHTRNIFRIIKLRKDTLLEISITNTHLDPQLGIADLEKLQQIQKVLRNLHNFVDFLKGITNLELLFLINISNANTKLKNSFQIMNNNHKLPVEVLISDKKVCGNLIGKRSTVENNGSFRILITINRQNYL